MKIKQVIGREILDSLGNPTVEAKVILDNGLVGIGKVPSGVSTGVHEAHELRDGGKRYGGKGVLKAVKNINTIIAKALVGMNIEALPEIDAKMLKLDGTRNKANLGGNAILGVSLACARAGALNAKLPLYKYLRTTYKVAEKQFRLPVPMCMIIEGGRHADSGLSVQEFMIIPRHSLLRERVRMCSQIFHSLGNLLSQKGYNTAFGDEGGYAADLLNNEKALQFMVEAIKQAGWVPGKHVFLAVDVAASEFYRHGSYFFVSKKQGWRPAKLIETYEAWIKKYPLYSIEDGLAEDDWENWKLLTKHLGKKVCLVGDDLFVTNQERIQKGVNEKVANAVLIKPNQIGTVSETMEAIKLVKKSGYQTIISHRGGETTDTFIADLAVAVNAEFIKTSISRSERTEKYNRLMEIENEVN